MNNPINWFLTLRFWIVARHPYVRTFSGIPNSSPSSLTNSSFSWSLLRLPISEIIMLSLRASAHTGVAIPEVFSTFCFCVVNAMKMWLIGLKSAFHTDELFSLYQWILLLYWVDFTPMNRSIFYMKNLDFEWLTDEFMLYCRSTQLREKTWAEPPSFRSLAVRWTED